MSLVNKTKYYLKIIYLMLTRTQNWYSVLFTKKVILRPNYVFNIHTPMDWYIAVETVVFNCYHLNTSSLSIIDIGAAFGDFSILASNHSLHVYSIEPEPDTYQLLQQNIIENKKTNISTFPIAISSTKKNIKLSINSNNHNHSNSFSKENTVIVSAVSLNKFISDNLSNSPIIVKCDCEGGEYDIFNSLPKKTFDQIAEIYMEYHLFTPQHQTGFNQLQSVLSENGYSIKLEANPIHSNIGFLFAKRVQKLN